MAAMVILSAAGKTVLEWFESADIVRQYEFFRVRRSAASLELEDE
jgi:hypothetical protein